MGFSIFYLAVKGKSPDAVHQELGLHATGERECFPESPVTAAVLADGWHLTVWNHARIRKAVQAGSRGCILDRLSSGCELLTCYAEEHVMYSAATAWKDGRKIWAVIHDAQKNTRHLVAEGELPPDFASIRDELMSLQDDEGDDACDNVFEIPVTTVQKLTGYRYDKIMIEPGDPFEVLVSARPASRPFWKRLFGV